MAAWSAHGKIGAAVQGAEDADTPVLCETCLGPNPYIRMTKDSQGKLCKICTRPFTVFRWNPGSGSRFKKTEICTTCAKVKNVCQTCILDLQYGLPVQVRDAALSIKSSGPSSDVNREYFAQTMDQQLEGATPLVTSSAGPASRAGQELLKKVARVEPEYKRKRPQLCSAFALGNCTRGDDCPYRHELPANFDQNAIAYAQSDPAATRPPQRLVKASGLAPPDDTSVTSLFISSLPESIDEDTIKSWVHDATPQLRPDYIKSITLVTTSKCAFVNFTTREAAELVAQQCSPKMYLKNKEIRVTWGRSKPKKKTSQGDNTSQP